MHRFISGIGLLLIFMGGSALDLSPKPGYIMCLIGGIILGYEAWRLNHGKDI